MNQQPDPAEMDRVNQALFAGRLIEAIKIYRTATGCGLKEAKDFVEALEARLRAEVPERFTAAPRERVNVSAAVYRISFSFPRPGCAVILLIIAAAIGAIVLLLRG